jgi:predicted metal-dependent enzyme (double-stranded beta helix superfamily)
MADCNWLVTDTGRCEAIKLNDLLVSGDEPEVYRLYRFLTHLEDILHEEPDEVQRIQRIMPLVHKLLVSSYWLQMEFDPPSAKTGWSVRFLYQEYEFPLTVQMVAWAPGQVSTIHNHATWGIVALIGGQERNRFWQRDPNATDQIQPVGEQVLLPGDMIGFTSGAIHCVEALGDEPTISFNLYGVTDYQQRYEFDIQTQTAKLF